MPIWHFWFYQHAKENTQTPHGIVVLFLKVDNQVVFLTQQQTMTTSQFDVRPNASVAGVLSLLEEDDQSLKLAALQKLDSCVDTCWAEISEVVSAMFVYFQLIFFPSAELAANSTFPNPQLASLVCSKVFFHLGQLDESLKYALGANELFDVTKKNDNYVDTLLAKCIDTYIQVSQAQETVDNRLAAIVERMFERCYADGEFKQALGIAIESHRLDKVAECILKSGQISKMLAYCFDIAMNIITTRDYRHLVHSILLTHICIIDFAHSCAALWICRNTRLFWCYPMLNVSQ